MTASVKIGMVAPMLTNVFRVRARVGLGLGLGFVLGLGLDMVYQIKFELAKTVEWFGG